MSETVPVYTHLSAEAQLLDLMVLPGSPRNEWQQLTSWRSASLLHTRHAFFQPTAQSGTLRMPLLLRTSSNLPATSQVTLCRYFKIQGRLSMCEGGRCSFVITEGLYHVGHQVLLGVDSSCQCAICRAAQLQNRKSRAHLTMRSACFCSELSSGIAALMKRLAPATSTLRVGRCSCSHFSDSTLVTFLS